MALQHFYSRVPARMSAFNRTDSFDTFAFSAGLEREFIEKELTPVYTHKPSKNDAEMIRSGKLKLVYCQYFTKSGRFVQSCTSFIPLDYTGERSAYLAHTLVPDEAEEKELLTSPDNAPFNTAMFKKSIDEFDLTGKAAKPITDYPAVGYEVVKAPDTAGLLEYDQAMMKRLIFAMLYLACGKGKTIFVSMPYEIENFSEESVGFINSVLQIFPYHIRRAFSFVSYSDDGAINSGFNMCFVPDSAPEIPSAKGTTLHFGSKIAIGLSDEMVMNNSHVVDFFYGLIKNDSLRREFLVFIENAVKADPGLAKANLKTVTELVFLFQQCSGLFAEKNILPTDAKVYDFVCAYDKHRTSLPDEYRARALTCLKRYGDTHTVIPKDIFQKVGKIYPAEPLDSKKVVMETVLEMIHTDLMREKLFSFIKANYPQEEPEMRSEITVDLCRVYYGGFLQKQILAFFGEVFADEKSEVRDNIVDRLLLTIRTPSISGNIIDVFDKHYDVLTGAQKNRIYRAFYEILPEADKLTLSLIKFIDRHIDNEDAKRKEEVTGKITKCAAADEKSDKPKLVALLLKTTGFCASKVSGRIVSSLSDKPVFARFVGCFKSIENIRDKLKLLCGIWDSGEDIPADAAAKWAEELTRLQSESPSEFTLFDLIEYDKTLSGFLSGGEAKAAFARGVLDGYVRPMLSRAVPKIITAKMKPDVFGQVLEYACDKPYITGSDEYATVGNYILFFNAAKEKRYSDMVDLAPAFSDKSVSAGVSEHIKANIISSAAFGGEEHEFTKTLTKFLLTFIGSGELNFLDTYTGRVAYFTEKALADGSGTDRRLLDAESAKSAAECTAKIAELVYLSESFAESREGLFERESSLHASFTALSRVVKKLEAFTDEMTSRGGFDAAFSEKLAEMATEIYLSGSILRKLLRKCNIDKPTKKAD